MFLRTKDNLRNTVRKDTSTKNFKTKASAGRAMLTVFWIYESFALTDCLVNGATVNSERYIETLQRLKKFIRKKGQEVMISCFNKTL